MDRLFMQLFSLNTQIGWYESRVEMGHYKYISDLAQARILARYVKVLRYLDARESRKLEVAA